MKEQSGMGENLTIRLEHKLELFIQTGLYLQVVNDEEHQGGGKVKVLF